MNAKESAALAQAFVSKAFLEAQVDTKSETYGVLIQQQQLFEILTQHYFCPPLFLTFNYGEEEIR